MDQDGNFVFQSIDKKKTSSVWYTTIGFTLSRCVLGEKKKSPDKEFVVFIMNAMDVPEVEDMGNGYALSRWRISSEDLLGKICKYYPGWIEEIQSAKTMGTAVYLCFDALMVTTNYGKQEGFLFDDGSHCGYGWGDVYGCAEWVSHWPNQCPLDYREED